MRIIKRVLLPGSFVIAVAVAPVAVTPSAAASAAAPTEAAPTVTTVHTAIGELPVAVEEREGYSRSLFRHWVDADSDTCDTRREVLLEETVTMPEVGAGCQVTADTGEWYSYYDQVTVNNAGSLDIDHMVPLAEAWDSGASDWTAARRQAFANDLDAARSLVAVTARSNRAKADRDPAEWWVPAESGSCRYLADWVATKVRWQLAIDEAELSALQEHAGHCPDEELVIFLAE
ncbi:MAG: HNH endonuclease family protein [Natronosporangium sp.]